ncbi:MAG TPA: hypothetical protein VJ750_08330 [Rhizomicrobium sp.]|nr:hypothetical protein [Rhizomicrobium sp.]
MSEDAPFVASTKGFLDCAIVTGRYSAGLIRQFDAHVENRTANIFQIFGEIAALEGAANAKPSRTKPASEFKRKLLNGLWHKHYTQACFLATNLKLHWTRDKLRRLIKDSYGGREFFDEQAAKELSYRFVQDGYLERSSNGELTGEWIVFAKQDDKAYYLTLGAHTEGDEAIWRRCKACASEFSDLKIIQEDR